MVRGKFHRGEPDALVTNTDRQVYVPFRERLAGEVPLVYSTISKTEGYDILKKYIALAAVNEVVLT